jgi:hypothetical protein
MAALECNVPVSSCHETYPHTHTRPSAPPTLNGCAREAAGHCAHTWQLEGAQRHLLGSEYHRRLTTLLRGCNVTRCLSAVAAK